MPEDVYIVHQFALMVFFIAYPLTHVDITHNSYYVKLDLYVIKKAHATSGIETKNAIFTDLCIVPNIRNTYTKILIWFVTAPRKTTFIFSYTMQFDRVSH